LSQAEILAAWKYGEILSQDTMIARTALNPGTVAGNVAAMKINMTIVHCGYHYIEIPHGLIRKNLYRLRDDEPPRKVMII